MLEVEKNNAKEIFSLDVALIEIIINPMLVAFYIVVWNQTYYCLGEIVVLNGCAKSNQMCLHQLER